MGVGTDMRTITPDLEITDLVAFIDAWLDENAGFVGGRTIDFALDLRSLLQSERGDTEAARSA